MGTEMALKVKAQPSFKMVSVLNYKKDPDVIQHIKDQFPHQEVTYLSNMKVHIIIVGHSND
jgi:hypothetical protein